MDVQTGLNVGAAVLFGLFLKKLVDTLRLAAGAARQEPGAAAGLVTQLVAFGAGLVAVFLFAASDLGQGLELGGLTLGDADGFSKVILGLLAASVGGTLTDVLKSVDNTQTAALPSLLSRTTTQAASTTAVRRSGP